MQASGSALSRRDGLDRFATLLAAGSAALVATLVAFTSVLFRDGDIGWHVASGRVILGTGEVPHVDPLSFTFRGQPWVAHEWLADVVTAATFDHAGWAGLAALSAACIGLTLFVMARTFLKCLPARWALLPMLLVPAVLLPFFHARPHLFAFPLIAFWMAMLLGVRERGRAPPWWAALLVLLWANLHGSFIIGLGIAGLFTAEALLDGARGGVRRGWIVFLALSVAASLATPHGIDALLFPFQVSNLKILHEIGEWARTDPAGEPFFMLLVLECWALVIVRRRTFSPFRTLIVAGLTVMAFAHMRHQAMFAIVVPMLVISGPGFGSSLPPQAPRQSAVAAILALVLIAVRLAVPANPADRRAYPMRAIAQLPAELRRLPVLNEYSFGGPLTMAGIAPFIDGRADMYGDAFVANYMRIVRGSPAAFDAAVARYGICWTLFPPKSGVLKVVAKRPDWHRVYQDEWAVIHVRDGCLPQTEKGDPLRGRPSQSRALQDTRETL